MTFEMVLACTKDQNSSSYDVLRGNKFKELEKGELKIP